MGVSLSVLGETVGGGERFLEGPQKQPFKKQRCMREFFAPCAGV